VKYFLDHGAEVNGVTLAGSTPLMVAASADEVMDHSASHPTDTMRENP
jgi:hypothetical protein